MPIDECKALYWYVTTIIIAYAPAISFATINTATATLTTTITNVSSDDVDNLFFETRFKHDQENLLTSTMI